MEKIFLETITTRKIIRMKFMKSRLLLEKIPVLGRVAP
jgi:hypothetical protein